MVRKTKVVEEKNNTIYHEYLHYQNKYSKQFGKDRTIVLMKVGDFWECYATDDEGFDLSILSELLNVAKTRKNKSKEICVNNPYMLGFPISSLDRYVKILMEAQFTVVICDQITAPPKPKRGITAIYSPSTYINNDSIQSNYIVSLYIINEAQQNSSVIKSIGLCAADCSTGTCVLYEAYGSANDPKIALDECYRFILNYNPKEVLIIGESSDMDLVTYLELEKAKIHKIPNVDKNYARIAFQNEYFAKVFGNNSLLSPIEFLNIETMTNARISFITLLNYIHLHNERFIESISPPEIFLNNKHLILYNDAIQQLNVLENGTSSSSQNSKIKCLFDVINQCVTPMGKRYIRYQICNPLNDIDELNLRYNCIEEMINMDMKLDKHLQLIGDLQKLSRRITLKSISSTELLTLVESCEIIKELHAIIKTTKFNSVYNLDDEMIKNICAFTEVCRKIFDFNNMIKYNSISDIDDTIFNVGIYPEIDKLHNQIAADGATIEDIALIFGQYIDNLIDPEEGQKAKKTTTNVQLKKSKKLGTYLHLPRAKGNVLKEKLSKITEIKISDTITLNTNNLLYDEVTKDKTKIFFKDTEINSAKSNMTGEKLKMLVKKKYFELLDMLNNKYSVMFRVVSVFISKIDFSNSGAKTALMYGYCRPIIVDNDNKSFVDVKELRHPISELVNNNTKYISHDICLGKYNDKTERMIDGMLTYGSNSSGKSNLMKAIGLSIIMAQTGLYVPGKSFEYFPYQQLFTRISNQDNLYKRLSSYSYEMTEIAKIILRTSKNSASITLADEPVSSTEYTASTSIVGAMLIKLAESQSTFVMTSHMHHLASMDRIKNLKNVGIFNLSTKYDAKTDTLIFDRILGDGNGDELYGLLVAKYIVKDTEFMALANNIKDELTGENSEILPTKNSKYNKNLYLDKCAICHKKNTNVEFAHLLDVHHIGNQANCDCHDFVIGTHQKKNDMSNLVVLCKNCHYGVHHNKLKINGYLDTSRGRVLDFEVL